VAERLGLRPNALYTYVADRTALDQAIVERVLAEAAPSTLPLGEGSWRERIVTIAISVRAALLRHPGAVPLFMTAPMTGRQALAVGERLLALLVRSGASQEEAARAAYAVMTYVLGSVALEVAETDARPPLPSEAERVAERRMRLDAVDASSHPYTAATRAVAATWVTAEQFLWGLDRLLDGLTPDPRRVP